MKPLLDPGTPNVIPHLSIGSDRLPPARQYLGRKYVYCVISARAGGLSIGVNMNPDARCNFECVYCEIDRGGATGAATIPVLEMERELMEVLNIAREPGGLASSGFAGYPEHLLKLKEVALSGDGEPTLCPNFAEVVQTVIGVRARGLHPFFKIVLITNGSGLDRPEIQAGIDMLGGKDEVWVKLDAGSADYFEMINRPEETSFEHIFQNIKALGQKRPIVIQSLFAYFDGRGPSEEEIDAYIQRLLELKTEGTQIQKVQIYSVHRPAIDSLCAHLPLRTLSQIARRVRDATGLKADVF